MGATIEESRTIYKITSVAMVPMATIFGMAAIDLFSEEASNTSIEKSTASKLFSDILISWTEHVDTRDYSKIIASESNPTKVYIKMIPQDEDGIMMVYNYYDFNYKTVWTIDEYENMTEDYVE